MRKLIAWAFMYSRQMAFSPTRTPSTGRFRFGLPVDPAANKQKVGLYQSAYAHIMGRTAYEAMAGLADGRPTRSPPS